MRDPFEAVSLRSRYIALGIAIMLAMLVYLGSVNPSALGAVGVLFFFFVVMIALHELGHFVFAKRAGMKVSEFFVGFGPRIWSVQRGETEYGLKALPLGGYCKILGMTNLEEVDPADEPRAYRNSTFWGKFSTLIAGPGSHFVLAAIMIWAVLAFRGDIWPDHVHTTTTIGAVEQGTPAARAGLRVGDQIVFLAGHRIHTWQGSSALIHDNGGKPIDITVERAGKQVDLRAKLARSNPDGQNIGYLGIAPRARIDKPGLLAAATQTPSRFWETGRETVSALGSMFSPSGISKYVDNFSAEPAQTQAQKDDLAAHRFISPVGVGKVAYDAVDAGWVTVFGLLISINLFIGLLNLLPLIPFDGGHIAIAMYEAVASRIQRRRVRADFNKLMPVAIATLAFFGFIFLSSLFLDIAHPVANPF